MVTSFGNRKVSTNNFKMALNLN